MTISGKEESVDGNLLQVSLLLEKACRCQEKLYRQAQEEALYKMNTGSAIILLRPFHNPRHVQSTRLRLSA